MLPMPIADFAAISRELAQSGRRVHVMWQTPESLAFVARGREYRSEFHINPSDEVMYMIKGEMNLHYRTPEGKEEIALLREGRFVLGVSCAPVYGELAWAERGQGAWLDGKRIRTSATAQLGATILSTGNLKTLAQGPRWARFGALVPQLSRLRGYGDFVHYHLLARGALDVVVESDVNILDIAALAVIVEEAGGRFTDLDGGAVGLETTTVLASNGALHDTVLAALR
jgi:histidinol-phosphatase